jgi:hypothetical protein
MTTIAAQASASLTTLRFTQLAAFIPNSLPLSLLRWSRFIGSFFAPSNRSLRGLSDLAQVIEECHSQR